jgi:subtilisin-like proprotein convertase family protein
MYLKRRTWTAIGILCLIGAVALFRLERKQRQEGPVATASKTNPVPLLSLQTQGSAQVAPGASTNAGTGKGAAARDTNPPFPYRISNTARRIDDLVRSDSAILLRNALIDSASGTPLEIPAHLRSQSDPGSYIVQSQGTITEEFRARLKASGAEVVAYVPNNAYLVRVNGDAAAQLRGLPEVLSVMPWEPYFKLAPKLLELAVEQRPLPNGNPLNVLTFPGETAAVEQQLRDMGATMIRKESSIFGTEMLVHAPPDKLVAVAQLGMVQAIEPAYRRGLANDLARTRVQVSSNGATLNSHLDLRGNGIRIGLNDTGVSADHPDLFPRMIADNPANLTDFNGHGTHVAGILASSGDSGPVWTNVPGSMSNANYRGMAPEAFVFVQPIDLISGPLRSDAELQETGATNGVFISNNSWTYLGAFDYTFASAKWDAAVRDSVPRMQGSQAITYVFAAGNEGEGEPNGTGGFSDTLSAPATAKNVITVGATEQLRNITNEIVFTNSSGTVVTNMPFAEDTDTDYEVASFSSRGNVGIGVESSIGRFKPDVVAPGVFLVSTRASNWAGNLLVSATSGFLADEIVPVGQTNLYFFFGAPNTIEARVHVLPNNRSPVPFPTNSIYVRRGAPPPPSDSLVRSNSIIINPLADDIYYFGVGNNFNQDLHLDLQVIVLSTNPPTPGDLQMVALNTNLGTLYRYESGTSMAAPVVSGILALMQEQLRNSGVTNPSPALMKALLINGARSIGNYHPAVGSSGNLEGWGIANITNSMPLYASVSPDPTTWPVRFFDQETNALVSGDSQTRTITLSSNQPAMRMTLVWTDPPGNPAVGLKLVNDLDLIVTNLTTRDVYVGNVLSGDFSSPLGTNALISDVVNNVENVFIASPRAGQYSVTVRARHVNVNAVTAADPRGIAQDYALVISAGNPGNAPGFSVSPAVRDSDITPPVGVLTNGVATFSERIGANPPYFTKPGTNGLQTQWRFFVFENTNTVNNTNVAFFTFLPPELSRVRTSQEADIDLFVSTNSALTNLNPLVLATAATSKNPGGNEAIGFSNATAQFYYIGIKSEDQQASSFGLFGFAGPTAFTDKDSDGSIIVHGLGVPVDIPDGSSDQASAAMVFGLCPETIPIRNVIVTNTLTHEHGGDLIGFLTHNAPGRVGLSNSVLNNHKPFVGTNLTYIYDDSDSGKILDSIRTDPPGTLRNFWGLDGQGAWQLLMIDDALISQGRVEGLTIRLEPAPKTNDTNITVAILPNRWFYTVVDVPADAILLGIDVGIAAGNVELYVGRNYVPDQTTNDYFVTFAGPAGGTLDITPSDSPPLTAGLYFIGLRNPNSSPITVNLRIRLERNLLGPTTKIYQSPGGPIPIIDDAVTTALLNVTNAQEIFDLRVGVRIKHDRASDLVLTLVSPGGTRVLLAENRGGDSPYGYGGDWGASGPPTVTVMSDGFENAPCGVGKLPGSTQSGWLVESGDVDIICNNNGFLGSSHTGAQGLDLNGYYPGSVSRTFATIPGKPYVLSHAYCRNPNSLIPNFTALADLLVDGVVVRSLAYGPSNTASALNWATNIYAFTAAGSSTKIQFTSRNTAPDPACGTPCGGMYLDTVEVKGPNPTAPYIYTIFTDNTNLTMTPIKFAEGPFTNQLCRGTVMGSTQSLVIPAGMLNVEGFAASGSLDSANRVQNVYNSSQFPAGVMQINELRFRPDVDSRITTGPVTTLASSIQVRLSSSSRQADNLNTILAGNTGPDEVLVYDGPFQIRTAFTGPVAGPKNFDIIMPLQRPFLYDRSRGNLLVDIQNNFGASPSRCVIDPQSGTGNGASRVIAIPPSGTTGGADSAADVIELGYSSLLTNVSGCNYVFPEEPLSQVRGEDAYGTWRLEIWDNRVGASNNAQLVSWQLDFDLVRTNPPVILLTNSQCYTGIAAGSNVSYFRIKVPFVAGNATNTLTSTNGNLMVLSADLNNLPVANPFLDDYPPSTNNPVVLEIATNSFPPLPQGRFYYLAVQNADPTTTNDFTLCITFDNDDTNDLSSIITITNTQCITATIPVTNLLMYFQFDASSNAVEVAFDITNATENVDMVVRRGLPLPNPTSYDAISSNPGSNPENITITDFTFSYIPGRWYIGVYNRTNVPVTFTLCAREVTAPTYIPVTCTNGVIGPNGVQYLQFSVLPQALRAHVIANNLSGDIDMYLNPFPPFPPPGPTNYSRASTNSGAIDEVVRMSLASTPPLIPGGSYYVALVNRDPVPNTYDFCVLQFTNYVPLTNGLCFYDTIVDINDAHYYQFTILSNSVRADFMILQADGDVDLYLRRTPPPGPGFGNFDYASEQVGLADEVITVTTNDLPALAPGDWYLAVVSRDPFTTPSYCIMASQSGIGNLSGINCTNAVTIAPYSVQYYQYTVSSNALAVTFATTNSTGDVDMYLNPSPPLLLPGPGAAAASSAAAGSGNEMITLSSGTTPPLQPPRTYLIGISNAAPDQLTYQLCVTEVTNLILLANAVCYTNTVGVGGSDYYRVMINTNSQRADFMTLDANGNVDLYILRVPLPAPTSFDYASENGGTTNELIVVTRTNAPVPLTDGDWYIAVVNRDPNPVIYCVKVTQYPVLAPFDIALRITNRVSSGFVDLGWNGFDFQRFYVEWTPTLSTNPIPWQPVTSNSLPLEFGPYGGSGTNFWHVDQPIAPMRFYRLRILP